MCTISSDGGSVRGTLDAGLQCRALVTVDCAAAADLADDLRTTNKTWQPYPGDWIFRGQFDSNLKLCPAAFRSDLWKSFAPPGKEPFEPAKFSGMVQAQREYLILRQFFAFLDRSGLEIPNELSVRSLFDHWGIADAPNYNHREFMTDAAIVTFAALAQHHGVPTRFLDWTRAGLNAAYFAAAEAASHANERGFLAVWCQSTAFTDHVIAVRRDLSLDLPDLRLLTAPRGSNPNLHAQSGLFSAWFSADGAVSLEDIIERILIALPKGQLGEWKEPPMRLLRLPWSETPSLLRILSEGRVDSTHMFPGRDGVVRFMKERRFWDRER